MKGPGILGAFLRLPPPTRRAAVEAAVLLALARVLVSFVPMRRWRRWLNAAPTDADGPAGRRTLGHEVGGMVQRVAVRLPFRAACLPQAMAAQWMLRRRGVSSRLTFGVRRAPGSRGGPGRHPGAPRADHADPPPPRLHFHAWLTVAGEPVVGGREVETYAPLPEAPPPVDARARAPGRAPRP